MRAIFISLRVRKLTVKPPFLTSGDCECKARRIHTVDYDNGVPIPAGESNAFRNQSGRRDVEVYNLAGHPTAKRCYGWSYGEPEQFITILELPPVKSAQDAVKVGIAHQVKQARKK